MRGLRKVLLTGAATALAITALGAAPASAADTTGTIAFVNGHPGVSLDVCIGSKEQRSGLPYGAYFHKKVIGTGPKLVRFFKRNDARTCGGTLVAKKWVNIGQGWDKTLVVTKRSPKLLVFDNNGSFFLGEIPPSGPLLGSAWHAQRSAADFDVDMQMKYYDIAGDIQIFPSAVGTWTKGDERLNTANVSSGFIWSIQPFMPGTTTPIISKYKLYQPSRRYEWILVGTKKGNAKMVVINRGASQPSP